MNSTLHDNSLKFIIVNKETRTIRAAFTNACEAVSLLKTLTPNDYKFEYEMKECY